MSEKYIVIIRTSALGDIVLTTAVLSYLRVSGCSSRVIYITKKPGIELLKPSFPEISFFDIESLGGQPDQQQSNLKANSKSVRTTKHGLEWIRDHAGIVFDLQNNIRSRLIAKQFKHASVFTYRKPLLPRLLQIMMSYLQTRWSSRLEKEEGVQWQYREHLRFVDHYLTLWTKKLETSGNPLGLKKQDSFNNPNFLQTIRPWLDGGETKNTDGHLFKMALAPGASKDPKVAPSWLMIKAVLAYQKQHNSKRLEVGIFGSKDDKTYIKDLVTHLKGYDVTIVNYAESLELSHLPQTLSQYDVLLCSDSAPSHVAEAVGVAVVKLYGPTTTAFGFGPFQPQSRSVSLALGCRPCSKHGASLCRFGDRICLLGIESQTIADALHATQTDHMG